MGSSCRFCVTSSNPSAYDRVHTEYGAPGPGEGESNETKYTAKIRKTPPSQAFFQLYDEEDAKWGVRPVSVTDPVPQGRVQRHTVEHRIDASPFVQILDAPVPQMGDQVLEKLQKIPRSPWTGAVDGSAN